MADQATDETQRLRDMIESRLKREGFPVREWRDDPDEGPIAVLGRFRVVEDDEDAGLYEGDEGELTASIVGAQRFHNERVCFAHTADGYDDANEVRDLSLVDPVE